MPDRASESTLSADQERVQEARQLALAVLDGALKGRVADAALLNVSEECSYTDFILILEGRSDRQVQAIADRVLEALETAGTRPLGVEGRGGGWVLVDLGGVVVHVFRADMRAFYDLEGLWAHCPREDIADRLQGADQAGEDGGDFED